MKHFLIFIFIVISLVTACSINSPTPSLSGATPVDSAVFVLDSLIVIDFYLTDFEQEVQMQISEEPSFNSILFDSVFHEENHHYIPADFFRENTIYYWRIRGRSSDNEFFIPILDHRWSDWSECLCFFVR